MILYKNIDGDEAFLSGVVSTLSDETISKIVPRYRAVEADVFKSDINNIVCRMERWEIIPESFLQVLEGRNGYERKYKKAIHRTEVIM